MKVYVASFFASLAFGLCCMMFMMNEESSEAIRSALTMSPRTQPEPVASFAFAPGDQLVEDINFLAKSIGVSKYHRGFVESALDNLMAGVERSKPMGGLVFIDNESDDPFYLAGIPVADLEKLQATMEQFGTINQSAWGTTVELHKGGMLMVKQVDDYVFVSNEKKCFHFLPDNPEELFANVLGKHTVSVQYDGQEIPVERKDQFWASAQSNLRNNMAGKQTPIKMDKLLKQVKGLIYDVEQLNVCVDVDKDKCAVAIRTELTGTEESWIANEANKNLTMEPTKFIGFRQPDAAFNFFGCSNTSSDDFRQMKSNFERLFRHAKAMSTQQIPDFPSWLSHLDKAFESTLEADRIDLGTTMVLKNGKPNLAFGAYVAETSHIKNLVNDVCAEIDRTGVATNYRKSFAQHRGVVFHEIFGDTDIDEVKAAFGKDTQFTIGIGENAFYLAMGESGFEVLKKCIDDSADSETAEVVVSFGEFSLAPILKLAGDHPLSQYAANVAKNTHGTDKIQFESYPVENGFVSRVNIYNGFTKTLVKSITKIGAYARQGVQSGPIRVDGDNSKPQTPFSSMERTF